MRICELPAQLPIWNTVPCRLSATAYSVYSQLPLSGGLRTRHFAVTRTKEIGKLSRFIWTTLELLFSAVTVWLITIRVLICRWPALTFVDRYVKDVDGMQWDRSKAPRIVNIVIGCNRFAAAVFTTWHTTQLHVVEATGWATASLTWWWWRKPLQRLYGKSNYYHHLIRNMRVWPGFNWLRTGIGSRLFWT